MDWKDLVFDCVQDLCAEKDNREFTLAEIYSYVNEMKPYYPDNNHIKDKIRQQLQYLRDDGVLSFKRNTGNYILGGE